MSSPPLRWFVASTMSGSLADGIAGAALPLTLVTLTSDPVLVALLPVALGLPWLLFSLHAGVLVDRGDRRTVLWIANAARAVLALILVALVATNLISIAALLAVGFLEGCATVIFRAASPAMVPSLVPREELIYANRQVQTGSMLTGTFLGPALGGVLYAVAAALPFATQSVSMVFSSSCLRRLPRQHVSAGNEAGRTMRQEIREGLRTVMSDRMLRSLAVSTGLLSFSTGMLQAVLVLHVVKTLDAPSEAYGVLFTIFAVGSLIATRLVGKVRQLAGARWSLVIAATAGAASLTTIATAPNVYVAGGGMLLLGAGSMVYNITAVTVRQERTADALLGRVSSVSNLVGAGSIPIASLIAGAIAAASSTSVALLSAAFTCTIGLLWLVIDLRAQTFDDVNATVTHT